MVEKLFGKKFQDIPDLQNSAIEEQKSNQISRRDALNKILKLSGFGIGTLVFGPQTVDILLRNQLRIDEDASNDTLLEKNLRLLKNNYNISIETNFGLVDRLTTDVRGNYPSSENLTSCLEIVNSELIKYPPNFFSDNNISTLVFVDNLNSDGQDLGGAFFTFTNTLVINTNIHLGKFNPGNLHHELFHALDWNDNGYESDNRNWVNLHRCTCNVYNQQNLDEEGLVVFSSRYGSRSPVEDRAELARILMTREEHIRLLNILSNNLTHEEREIIESKIQLIKQVFYSVSCGQMDESYWQRLLSGEQVLFD